MRRSLSLLFVLVLAAGVAVPAARQDAEDTDPIVIEFGPDGMTLETFLRRIERELARPILFDPKQIEGFRMQNTETARVPRIEFRRFAEATLYAHDFVLLEHGAGLQLFSLDHSSGLRPGVLRSRAEVVPPERLHEYEGRYVPITAVFPVQDAEIQLLASWFQSSFSDFFVESVRASSHALLVTGFPHKVLRVPAQIDRFERARQDWLASSGRSQSEVWGAGEEERDKRIEQYDDSYREHLRNLGFPAREWLSAPYRPDPTIPGDSDRMDAIDAALQELAREIARLRQG